MLALRPEVSIRPLLAIGSILALASGGAWWLVRDPGGAPVAEVPAEEAAEIERMREALAMMAWLAQNAEPPSGDPFAREVVAAARRQLLEPEPGYRDDCSGFVSAVFTEVGVPMDGVVVTLWDHAVEHDALHWEEVPRIGDLAFFEQTYDRNGNGRWDEDLTHIGIVIDVEPDGTAVIAHAGVKSGRGLTRMNLASPSTHRDADGNVLNKYLRDPEAGDPATARYLTGELWVAFARVDPEKPWLEWIQPP